MTNKLAVVLIRGTVNTHPDVRKTLELLRLKKKHACVVIEDNEVAKGMLKRVKDYVTYGPIDEKTFQEIVEKRGQSANDQKVDAAKVTSSYFSGEVKLREFEEKFNVKPFFRLHPPKGGFERGGIKKPFTTGGVLGKRDQEAMQKLLGKML